MTTISTTPVSAQAAVSHDDSISAKKATASSTGPVSSNPNVPVNAAPMVPTPYGVNASLYVGELHPDVSESMLFELFNQVGPVTSIRVCRDAITRRSLGYAYVNFNNVLDAERALDTLNYTMVKGQACRIMWSQRDPTLRRSGTGNIFIKNLDKSIDNKALHDTFSAFGNILSCKVVTDDASESKGYGFVHFETKEAAEQAIQKVNGMLLNDKKVFVGHHVPRRERVSKIEELKAQFTNVYVKNLDESITDEELRKIFEPFGEISSAVVQRDTSDVTKSKGFGFINYVDHDSAALAVEELNEKEIKGKVLIVCRAQPKAEREEELKRAHEVAKQERLAKYAGVNLYAKNLDVSVDDERLRKEFSQFGEIASCKIMVDERNVSRGFGFVCYAKPEDATKAVQEMNGKMLEGKPIYVALAQRKEERRTMLEAQYAQRAQFQRFMSAAAATGTPAHAAALYYAAAAAANGANPLASTGGSGALPSNSMMYMMGGSAGAMPQRPAGMMMPPNASASGYPTHMMGANGNMYQGGRMPPRWMMQQGAGMSGAPNNGAYASTGSRPSNLGIPNQVGSVGGSNVPNTVNNTRIPQNGPVQGVPPMGGPSGPGGYRRGMMMGPGTPGSHSGYYPHTGSSGRPGMVPSGPSAMNNNPSGMMGPMMSRRGGMGSGYHRGMGMRGGHHAHQQHSGFSQDGRHQMMGAYPSSMQNPTDWNAVANNPAAGLTAAALASAPPEVQKQMLGERIYPLVYNKEPEQAPKITGMLLEMDSGELLHLLESPQQLQEKIAEASHVLKQHQLSETGDATQPHMQESHPVAAATVEPTA
jgi:polyadenylate-binding protein